VGSIGGLLSVGGSAFFQSSSWSSCSCVCCRILRCLVGFGRCDDQCSAIGWDDFFFPVGLRSRILRFSYDHGGSCRGPFQIASSQRIGVSRGPCCLGGRIFMVHSSIGSLHWPICCGIPAGACSISSLVLLHFLGLAHPSLLMHLCLTNPF